METAWVVIGSCVGVVLGLTGAGGAMVSVPLFVHWLDISLKDATTFSLYAVVMAALFNGVAQFRSVQYSLSIKIILFSLLGSLVGREVKPHTPDLLIKVLFIGICFYSFYSLWLKKKSNSLAPKQFRSKGSKTVFVGVSGIFLGFLITMTGLGGGVVIVPWMISIMGLNISQAVASSLFCVLFVVTGSIFVQFDTVIKLFDFREILSLGLGAVVAAFLIRLFISKLSVQKTSSVRKYVLTFILFSTVLSLLIKK